MDSDDDNLVVDENPSSSKRQRSELKRDRSSYSDEVPSDSETGTSPFRLRISCVYISMDSS